MAASVNARVNKRRQALRDAGLRPIQIWVPDSRVPGFKEEARRQSRLVAEADKKDPDLETFMNAAFEDLDD